jgi:large subunit ribosomal protein L9
MTLGKLSGLERQKVEDRIAKLEALIIEIPADAGADGRFYGAVTSKDICEALKKQSGFEIDKRKIELDAPIKAFGTYKITAKLFQEICATLSVKVVEKRK